MTLQFMPLKHTTDRKFVNALGFNSGSQNVEQEVLIVMVDLKISCYFRVVRSLVMESGIVEF
jgi:hypothetical protein